MSAEYTPSRDEMAFGFAKVLLREGIVSAWPMTYIAKHAYELADEIIKFRDESHSEIP